MSLALSSQMRENPMSNLYVAIFCLGAALANVPFWPEAVSKTLSLINFAGSAANFAIWYFYSRPLPHQDPTP